MNRYLVAVKNAITRQGRLFKYQSVGDKAYNVETGSTTGTDILTDITAYKQHVIANQYNYPALIGKEVNHFYISADSLPSKPKTQDIIDDAGTKYTVISVIEQEAAGQLVMFKVIAVKG